MSKETKLTYAAQVLLQGAEKDFEKGNRDRGIALIKDSLVLLGNGYEKLTKETATPLTESETEAMNQPDEDELNKVAGLQDAAGPAAEQPVEQNPYEQEAGAIKPFKLPESKDSAGVVSEPAKEESKPDAGVVSEPDKSQSKPGSGVV